MKVIVNGRFLGQKATGVQNYAREIVKSLIRSGVMLEVVTPPLKGRQFEFPVKPIGLSGGFIWEQFFLPQYVRRQNGSFLLNLCNSAPIALKNKAVTIHDLAFEQNIGKWFSSLFRRWYRYLIPKLCRVSRLIFTVSEFSKSELIKYYNVPAEKIVVAPPGLPDMTFDISSLPPFDYVVLTGANNPRKNALWVIKNIDILKKRGLKLILLGNKAKIFENVEISNLEDEVIYMDNVPSSSYFSLIRNAKALICPSAYEGFGITILESLSLGTPVVASNIEVFRESFGNIPLYFELGNIKSYEKAVESIKEKVISPLEIKTLKDKYRYDISTKSILKSIEALI